MATFRRGHASRRVKRRRVRVDIEVTVPVTLRESLVQKGTRYLTMLQLLNRDGEDCYLCGEALTATLQVDHIIPRPRGGSDHPLNLALACRTCNARKRDLIVSFDIADRRPVFRLP